MMRNHRIDGTNGLGPELIMGCYSSWNLVVFHFDELFYIVFPNVYKF